jgi:bifunctional non-homologous end joining protein LigD
VSRLKAATAWLDGEVCAVDAKGRSDFQSLQNALAGGNAPNLIYFAFDLLYLDGYDLTRVSLALRKGLLKALLERSATRIRYSSEVRGSGAWVFQQACQMGLEGVVSKRADSTYDAGLRTRNWVKAKCSLRQEMVIGGFTDPQGSRSGFGALLLGVYQAGQLQYSGKVGTGFGDKTLATIRAKLDRLARQTPPFANPPRGFEAKGVHWVDPALVAEVQFTEWSDDGALRHPSFVGLREDKKASDVVREKPVAVKIAASSGAGSSATKSAKLRKPVSNGSKSDMVAGVKLTHADKLFFPEAKLTKLALARYYEAVAGWIMPHVKDRPLSLFRCPDGWNNQCFYQKHADSSVHASVTRVEVPEGSGTATYFAASSLQALVGLVQWGVIELHPWGSRMPKPERPDRLIFDFDPAEDVSWSELVKAVHELQTLLTQLGLVGFLKTTGGKGLHVVVPIKATLTWEQAKGFTKAIADLFARTFPERFTATLSKAKRGGRIFIDYLRNAEGATAIAAYGIRARKNAPVSTPISWKELSTDVRMDFFNVKTVPLRLRKLREDPWKDFAAVRQTVTRSMLKQVGTPG